MVVGSLKICAHPGCRSLSLENDDRCIRHKNDKRHGWESSRQGSSTKRGYGSKWRKLRKLVLERDMYVCVLCRKNNIVKYATDVDHIKPKAQGGSDDIENLQSLCRACHRKKTSKEKIRLMRC